MAAALGVFNSRAASKASLGAAARKLRAARAWGAKERAWE